MLKPGSRDVLLLLTSMVLASVPVGYLLVVLPLYLNRAGLEPSVIGLLYSLSGLVTAGLVAFSGALADRFGRRGFLIWGTALPICSYVIFAATTDPGWLVVASVIGGVTTTGGWAGEVRARERTSGVMAVAPCVCCARVTHRRPKLAPPVQFCPTPTPRSSRPRCSASRTTG